MRKKIPLAWNIKPGMYAALNDKLEILVVEKTAEQAKSEAVIAGENPPFVVSTYDLQRPALLPKDVKSPSLILIGHNWRTGRLFLNKRSGSKSDTATLHGVYLDDLFVSPWTILNAKVFLSTVTVQIQPHTSISASSRDIYVYEPVLEEVKPYVEKIRYYIENSIFDKTVPNYINRNHDVKEAFKKLLKMTK